MAVVVVHVGFVQRFTIGFRGPLCLVSGFSGVTLADFVIGASIGACITMSIQILLVSFCEKVLRQVLKAP